MDILDFVPFMGFIRNDEETIAIMNQASKILPKACDILGISLSFSESDDEIDDTAGDTDRSSASQPQQVQGKPRRLLNKPKHEALSSVPNKCVPQPPKSRKRCVSTPSSLGQSTSSGGTTCATTIATLKGSGSTAPLPPKKRRLHSISSPASPSIVDNIEEEIRKKMMDDIESFNNKIKQLAALEKRKNRLLEQLLAASPFLQLQLPGNSNDNYNASRVQNGDGNENQSENESQRFENRHE